MSSHEAANAGPAQRMKSIRVLRTSCNMWNRLSQPRSTSRSKMMRVTTNAVNMLTETPMVSTTPNPFTGPVPMKIRMTDDTSVVRLESKMVLKALSYPEASAPRTDLPVAASSRMRSKMRTLASTAMPRVRTMPAMPGMVSVVLMEHITPNRMMMFSINATFATKPANR